MAVYWIHNHRLHSKGYTIKTHTDPDGSKTIHDSRVESCVIEVPPQAKSPYVDEEEKEEP